MIFLESLNIMSLVTLSFLLGGGKAEGEGSAAARPPALCHSRGGGVAWSPAWEGEALTVAVGTRVDVSRPLVALRRLLSPRFHPLHPRAATCASHCFPRRGFDQQAFLDPPPGVGTELQWKRTRSARPSGVFIGSCPRVSLLST